MRRPVKKIPNFKLKHFIYSSLAQKNKINNTPGSDYYNPTGIKDPQLKKDNITFNLNELSTKCINPILRNFKDNLALTSVYRNKEVNKAVGGVENSQHIYGYAVDMVLTNGIPTSRLFNWCKYNIPSYHQLIWEYPERGTYNQHTQIFSWVHISYITGGNEKINSVSSTDPKIHKSYQDEHTFNLDNFTHGITTANQQLLEQQ